MLIDLAGCWRLISWRRIEEGGTISYPLGEGASGILIYTADFKMAVQMVAAGRMPIHSEDALGGEVEERAAAYSGCLAYFGTYEVNDDVVTHHLEASLFPNWSGTVQARPFTYNGSALVLSTPPSGSPGHTVVNEISWAREVSDL